VVVGIWMGTIGMSVYPRLVKAKKKSWDEKPVLGLLNKERT
jgi:hypothetical protein